MYHIYRIYFLYCNAIDIYIFYISYIYISERTYENEQVHDRKINQFSSFIFKVIYL